MKLTNIEIAGFRGYREATKLAIEPGLTVVVGKNDVGKSTILKALDLYLSGSKASSGDFSIGDSQKQIEITCWFVGAADEVVLDSDYVTSLEREGLADRDGRIAIRKVWVNSSSAPKVFVYASVPAGGEDLLNKKIKDLRATAEEMGLAEDVPKNACAPIRAAIRNAWADQGLILTHQWVELGGEDAKSIARRLNELNPKFHYFDSDRAPSAKDGVAQDPMGAIIDSVVGRHEEELSRIAVEIEQELQAKLGRVADRMQEIAPSLNVRFRPHVDDPKWSKAFLGAGLIGDDGVDFANRGSGLRRVALLSFFRDQIERSDSVDNVSGSGLMIAVEEPETALQPRLQDEVYDSLWDISQGAVEQVIVTTHSSNLIQRLPVECLRFVEVDTSGCRQVHSTKTLGAQGLVASLRRQLGVLSDHSVRVFVMVEGRHDMASLRAYSAELSRMCPERFIDLSAAESDGLLRILPIGGVDSIDMWRGTLDPLDRVQFYLYDSDRERPDGPLKRQVQDDLESSNFPRLVRVLDRRTMESYVPRDVVLSLFGACPVFDQYLDNECSDGVDWGYQDLPQVISRAAKKCDACCQHPGRLRPLNANSIKEKLARNAFAAAASRHLEAGETNDLLTFVEEVTRAVSGTHPAEGG